MPSVGAVASAAFPVVLLYIYILWAASAVASVVACVVAVAAVPRLMG